MKKIASKLTDLIGNTPLLELGRYNKESEVEAKIVAKLEYFNPGGSVKDRVGFNMIEEAEKSGALKSGGTIIEPTSGNTGVGLALVAAAKGYKLILTMPETMSMERRMLLSALGAKLVLTEGKLGMKGAIAKSQELKNEIEGAIILDQFGNEANPMAHYNTTAEEIWRDCDGEVDIVIGGVGTGGTISGIGKKLKEYNKNIEIVAVEPSSSAVLSGNNSGPHKIQGIGAGFVPKNFNREVVDTIFPVENDDAYRASRKVAATEGLLVGISSGAALHAATQIAKKEENRGKTIVVILPDTGERYLSTDLFAFESNPL